MVLDLIMSENKKYPKLKKIVVGVALISIVTASSIVGLLGTGLFNFGSESGVFAVLQPYSGNAYYQGMPVLFDAYAQRVDNGKLTVTSKQDIGFKNGIIFQWYLKAESWSNYTLIDQGKGETELALQGLNIGTFSIKVALLSNYKVLNPANYKTVSNATLSSDSLHFDTFSFKIKPINELNAWITAPANYNEYTQGESVQFTGVAKRDMNVNVYKGLKSKALEITNQANKVLNYSKLISILGQKYPDYSSYLTDLNINQYYSLDQLNVTNENVNYSWYDSYIDNNNLMHSFVQIGNSVNLKTSNLAVGTHTIKFVVTNVVTAETVSKEITIYISAPNQPSLPRISDFLYNVVSNGEVFVHWNASIPRSPNGQISYYELQISKSSYSFPGNYIKVAGTEHNYTFSDLPSSVNIQQYEQGKYWFRVRSVDSFGFKSAWSPVKSIRVGDSPYNIYFSGIYLDNSTRVDYHNQTYSSRQGQVELASNYKIGNDSQTPLFDFDFYPGQLTSFDNSGSYNISLLQGVNVTQYENFNIKLDKINQTIPVDADTNFKDLKFYVYSSIDGLIYVGSNLNPNNPTISYKTQINEYLQNKTNKKLNPLSIGLHKILVIVESPSGISYKLPASLLNVVDYKIHWSNNTVVTNDPAFFLDQLGNNYSDWGQFGLMWDYPVINPYFVSMASNYYSMDEIYSQYIDHWVIEVNGTYLNKSMYWILNQYTSKPSHYWVNGSTTKDDSITTPELTSGLYNFRVIAVDKNGLKTAWSPYATFRDNNLKPLSPQFNGSYPIFLYADNKPPVNEFFFKGGNVSLDRQTITLRTGQTYSFDGSHSFDPEGATLTYRWLFDGVLKTNIKNFDPTANNITINPEWIGHDIDPSKNETTLYDPIDHYGDYGLHNITLAVSDGLSWVNDTVYVNILPPNALPSLSGYQITKSYNTSVKNQHLYYNVFQSDLWSFYPVGLKHIDSVFEKQNIDITYYIDNVTDCTTWQNNICLTGSTNIATINKIVDRKYFIADSDILTKNDALTVASLKKSDINQNLNSGDYEITIVIGDGSGYTIMNYQYIHILPEVPPTDLKLDFIDINGNKINIQNQFPIIANEFIEIHASWKHYLPDNIMNVELYLSSNNMYYNGPGIRDFVTRSTSGYIPNQWRNVQTFTPIWFTKSSGSYTIYLTVSSPKGKSATISQTFIIESPNIYHVGNSNSVASALKTPQYHQANYAITDRYLSDIAEPWITVSKDYLTNPKYQSVGSKDLTHGFIDLGAHYNTKIDYIRIWFYLDLQKNDYLVIKSKENPNVVWDIKKVTNYEGIPIYIYKNPLTSKWDVLPKMSLQNTPTNLKSSPYNPNKDYRSSYNWPYNVKDKYGNSKEYLTYVVIPGSSVDISLQINSINMQSKAGYTGVKIAYAEAFHSKPIDAFGQFKIFLDWASTCSYKVELSSLISFNTVKEIGCIVIKTIFQMTQFKTGIWITLPNKLKGFKIAVYAGLAITKTVPYADFQIQISRTWDINDGVISKVFNKFTLSLALDILYNLDSYSITSYTLTASAALSKNFPVTDVLLLVPPLAPVVPVLDKYNSYADQYKFLPQIPTAVTAKLSTSFSLKSTLGVGYSIYDNVKFQVGNAFPSSNSPNKGKIDTKNGYGLFFNIGLELRQSSAKSTPNLLAVKANKFTFDFFASLVLSAGFKLFGQKINLITLSISKSYKIFEVTL